MSYLTESYAWCMLQVTLFTAVAAGTYGVVRRLQSGTNSALLVFSLAVVGLLTLISVSPWPKWDATTWERQSPRARYHAATPPTGAFEQATGPLAERTVRASAPLTVSRGESAAREFPAGLTSSKSASPPAGPAWLAVIVAAWVAALLGLVRTLVAFTYLRRIRRRSTPLDDDSALQLSRALCQRLGIHRVVELQESLQLSVAATVGWWRPVVLLPCLWRKWSHDELRAVLAHELAHVRRQHFPIWLVSQAVLVAHYYHPVVHWLARRLRLEQEIDADQLAAELFGDRRHYAGVLAKLALGPMPANITSAGVGLFMSRPLLMRRIVMLRQSNDSVRGSSRFASSVMLVLLFVAGLFVAGLRAARPAIATEAHQAIPQSTGQITSQLPSALPEAPPLNVAVPTEAIAPATTAQPAQPMRNPEDQIVVEALLQVSSVSMGTSGDGGRPMSDAAWNVFSNSQIPLLLSHTVLQRALEPSNIATLPLVKSQKAPTEWLQRQLHVGFYPNTEILFIQMSTSPGEADQAKNIVDRVIEAYLDIVVNVDRERKIAAGDQLARSSARVSDELKHKMDAYYQIAKELESAEDGGSGQILQQLDMRRLDRVESEIMRLEDELLKVKISDADNKAKIAYYEQRLDQLHSRQQELEKSIKSRSEKSVDLSTRKAEIDQLQKLAGDMQLKLEMMAINADAPQPQSIRVIQWATVTGGQAPADKPSR